MADHYQLFPRKFLLQQSNTVLDEDLGAEFTLVPYCSPVSTAIKCGYPLSSAN
eukprot:JP440691.1.p3 GENE.JP440691.1~~JP440691.1.p3  ORF type:complete len:53 (-),score=7.00 JP440691.1:69-227(-)